MESTETIVAVMPCLDAAGLPGVVQLFGGPMDGAWVDEQLVVNGKLKRGICKVPRKAMPDEKPWPCWEWHDDGLDTVLYVMAEDGRMQHKRTTLV
jgi:hypothetical protein